MTTERRRSPRIAIVGQIEGRFAALDEPVRVRDFSLGGMAIEAARELPVGSTHAFLLTLGDGSLVELRGRVVRCRSLAGPGEPALYASGIQFIDDPPDADPGPRSATVLDKLG